MLSDSSSDEEEGQKDGVIKADEQIIEGSKKRVEKKSRG